MIRTPSDMKSYKRQVARSLADDFLAEALRRFYKAYPGSRANAFAGYDFESLADEVRELKDLALPRLVELFETFKANAEAAGVSVHLARTADEANRIIERIARGGGVKKVVKSKSMTAEETRLNDHLEAAGLQVVETDLGEWIIQLRREGPSHMVMPAIHLSRGQVADLFENVAGRDLDPDDIGALVEVARQELRGEYLSADMGVSGANFANADSGAIGLVTNEGNARLTTTLPRIHVALVGLEKLVPDLGAALKILRVLPKNATGQAITSYVTWIKGRNECAPAKHGRKEMHVVFLDNGRLELAADPVFSEALRCIRCGACANVCPVYKNVGGHTMGHVYIGAIGLVMTLFYHGRDNARAIVRNCLNCRACAKVCPGKIDLPNLIKKAHGRVMELDGSKPAKNRMLARVLPNRKLFHFLLRKAYLAQKPISDKHGMMRHLPLFFTGEHGFRSLPAVAAVPLRDRWPERIGPASEYKYKVALFGGCVVDFVYPEQGEALIRLIREHGVRLEYPMDQTCCGLPAMMAAEETAARKVAVQNSTAFDAGEYDYILTLCASCGSHLKHFYKDLKGVSAKDHEKAAALADKVIDFSSFMVDVLGAGEGAGSGDEKTDREKVVYHAPCHLCRGLDVTEAPRKLLELSDLDYVPVDNEETCCGFGGSWSFDFPAISERILAEKLDAAEEAGADVIVTDCPGCVMQLRGGLHKRGSRIKVKHIVETPGLGDKIGC